MAGQLSYHDAHEPYIAAVADALSEAGVRVADYHADGSDPRDGAIQLGESSEDIDGPVREVWVCWTEEAGWFHGVDKDGRSGLSAITWAHIGVLPEPAAVVAWVRTPAKPFDFASLDRPHYRSFEDDGDGFEARLRDYAKAVTA